MKIELSEKEIRVIKVALWKHFINMVDDDGNTSRKDLQPFADCCYATHDKISRLDIESDFNELK